MKDFGEFVKYIRKVVLEAPYNELKINIYDTEISFGLYDDGEIAIIYNGDVDDIKCDGLTDNGGYGHDMGTIKDIYKVMEAIKEHHEILDNLID